MNGGDSYSPGNFLADDEVIAQFYAEKLHFFLKSVAQAADLLDRWRSLCRNQSPRPLFDAIFASGLLFATAARQMAESAKARFISRRRWKKTDSARSSPNTSQETSTVRKNGHSSIQI